MDSVSKFLRPHIHVCVSICTWYLYMYLYIAIHVYTYVGESGCDGELRKSGGELRLITSRYSSATTWEG